MIPPQDIQLESVYAADKLAFLACARDHFTELNSAFYPLPEWERSFFESHLREPGRRVRWVTAGGCRAGFAVYGVNPHPYLDQLSGYVYELYVSPDFRRAGVGRRVAELILAELTVAGCSRIDLEVLAGNHPAERLWGQLGWVKHAERWSRKLTAGGGS